MHTANTVLGVIGIEAQDGALVRLRLCARPVPACAAAQGLVVEAFTQLEEYLSGARRSFELPLRPQGTAFMRRVWEALCAVPYGKTTSYKAIAAACGNEKAARAVGAACNKNPLAIFIPCHRIIGANGKLTGYAGGLNMKTRLLELERAVLNGQGVTAQTAGKTRAAGLKN